MGHWTPTGVEPKDYDDDNDHVNGSGIDENHLESSSGINEKIQCKWKRD